MYEITILADFEAAHCLPDYPGKCSRLHGHNWRIEVAVTGSQLDKLGMIVDFRILKQEVGQVLNTLDHYYLNELEPFRHVNPTAENIAKYLYDELSKNELLSSNNRISWVKVWESPQSAVTYRPEE